MAVTAELARQQMAREEDAFMVPGMGAQPVPPPKYVPANDNRAKADDVFGDWWIRHGDPNGCADDLVTTTFAPLEDIIADAKREYREFIDNIWRDEPKGAKEDTGKEQDGGYTVPDDVADAVVNLISGDEIYHEFPVPENSSLAAAKRGEFPVPNYPPFLIGASLSAGSRAPLTIAPQLFGSSLSYGIIERHGSFMQTYTGRKFWPMDPRASEIDIRDIAHSLSLQCRYAGHCRKFYSVAEHSVHIARWLVGVAPEASLWGLLHDASEAYLIDVPRPVKPFLSGYRDAEAKVMSAICQRFGLPLEMPAAVHDADERIIADELVNLVRMQWHARHDDPLGVTLQYWSPDEAEEEFLETFKALGGDRVGEAV